MVIRKILLLILSGWLVSSLTAQAQPPQATPHILMLYLLAFDNQPLSTANLTPQYQPTLETIIAATQGEPQKTAVILADLDGVNDTHILVIRNGQVLPILGLPDSQGVLNHSLQEYDMTSGTTLGNFIKWSRATYPASQTILTYVGHGAPLTPETDLSNLLGTQNNHPKMLNPLPSHRSLGYSFTDYHPLGLISPRDFATALQIGTDNGQNPLTVLDLVHCFSASVEEFYELSPYTQMLTGSPNYTYVTPTMLGQALAALSPEQSAADLANTLIKSYHDALPDIDHPRVLVAVDSSVLAIIKHDWDMTAYYLKQQLVNNRQVTKNKILNAYRASAKYDTTFCDPPDWNLAAPDALSDMADFAQQLSQQFNFGAGNEVGIWARATQYQVGRAIVAKYIQNGAPWFAMQGAKPNWQFRGAGLALYADFQALSSQNQTVFLSQQAYWYTTTVTAVNPQPYSFIQGLSNWAQVFALFWEGQTIQTAPCLLPVFPPAQNEGELVVTELMFPPTDMSNLVSVTAPLTPVIAMSTLGVTDSPLVEFRVWQNAKVVFSNTVNTGYLITGTHEVVASQAWQPQQSGIYTLEVTLDTDNRVLETNETDNKLMVMGQVLPQQLRPRLSGQMASEWQDRATLPITLTQAITPPYAEVKALWLQFYQYPPKSSPYNQIPNKVYENKLQNVSLDSLKQLPLPSNLQPGYVHLKIWGISAAGAMSIDPVTLSFNYIPTQANLTPGQYHYFLLNGQSGDNLKLELKLAQGGEASLLAWLPFKSNLPAWQAMKPGNDTLTLNPIPYTGQYLVAVHGESNARYQLIVTKNGMVQGNSHPRHVYLPLITRQEAKSR